MKKKEDIIEKLTMISEMGWIRNRRSGNVGGIGNTLEDLLGIEENNLKIADYFGYEIKVQRKNSSALLTLFHCEPDPREVRFVPNVFLPLYGWKHKEAGGKYGENEMSFRQTIKNGIHSDRGFTVKIEYEKQTVEISFEHT